MAKKHDENKDVRLLSRKVKVDVYNKTISASKSTIIGNRSWGRIDYLVNYCGYHFYWDNSAIVVPIMNNYNNERKDKKELKKVAKAKVAVNNKRKR